MNPIKAPANICRTIWQMFKYHSTYDIEKALRARKADGIRIGESRHLQVQSRCCERHALRLQELAPNLFTCVLCEPTPRLPEPHTDPLQNVPAHQPAVIRDPHGAFFQQVRQQPGHNTDSQILKVVGNTQLAQLKARMREKEEK